MTCHDRPHCQWNALDGLADLRPGDGIPADVARTIGVVLDHVERIGGPDLLAAVLCEREVHRRDRKDALAILDA